MPFCTSCGASMDENARFCTSCGALANPAEQAPDGDDDLKSKNGAAADTAEPVPEPQHVLAPDPGPVFVRKPEIPSSGASAGETVSGGQKTGGHANPARPAADGRYGAFFDQEPPSDSRFAVLSTGGYFGTLLLFCIPVIGPILAIIWALGGSRSQNRRNLSRAYLLVVLIALVLAAVCYLLLRLFTDQLLGWLPQEVDYYIRSLLYLW